MAIQLLLQEVGNSFLQDKIQCLQGFKAINLRQTNIDTLRLNTDPTLKLLITISLRNIDYFKYYTIFIVLRNAVRDIPRQSVSLFRLKNRNKQHLLDIILALFRQFK